MKSNKQRRAEQKAKKSAKRAEAARQKPQPHEAPVDVSALAPDNSYSVPDFVERGYYLDLPFRCCECGKEQVWTARQQKWWYEVAKGGRWTTAKLCRPCRQKERRRREAARAASMEGVAGKRATKTRSTQA